ncbi:MAG: LysR family transcriptional regulator [Pseudomonadales bacterium]|jgi:DNA-binding transcriptional LysR family regulator|nr:LysR family transcriptional regulator [Pseudomonadales bacterium]MDP6473153.1 LysR family transcriptional regulator [Pseudomonadales bacterium]MDP6826090.1 LysR family transcriptional regulator [Pseudomonadales bacterium]MDP6970377.1 LysR family transcriptional regulator [Pseudomonadales bacterium]
MQWSDLSAFLSVTQHGSFSRAATALHISQPAVTKRVQNLENELEVRLFDRIGRSIHLTDAGKLLKPRAEQILAQVSDTRRMIMNLHERVDGVLDLATSHHVGLHRLAPVLRSYRALYPDVQLDIQFEDSEAAHDLIRQGRAELAVVTLDPEGEADLTYLPLWDDSLHFVTSREHPLALRNHLTLDELSGHGAVLPGTVTYTGRIVLETFEARGLTLHPALSTNYLETIGMLVGAGLGWSVLPRSLLTEDLAELKVDAPHLHRTLGCVTNPGRTLSNAARSFIGVLEETREPGI